jgi:hypothetical protein
MCGHVRDALSGAAVPQAMVELRRRNLTALTRADGLYFFLDLRAGKYDLLVSAPRARGRYGTASVGEVQVGVDGAGRPLLDPRAEVRLPPTGVAGVVTDAATGTPLVGARARLRGADAETSTGADGRYRLSPLPPGAPTLEIRAPGYATETRKLGLATGQQLTVDIALSKT